MPNELNPNPTRATELRSYTPARIALARTGASLTTRDALEFTLAHARARDAVHAALSLPTLVAELHARNLPVLTVKSAAPDRATYLRRPDLGRTLSDASRDLLATQTPAPAKAPRLTIFLADGLSALATDRHALPLLDALLPLLRFHLPVINPAFSGEDTADLLTPPARPSTLPSENRPPEPSKSAETRDQDSAVHHTPTDASGSGLPTSRPFENPTDTPAWQLTPIVLAEQARVALGDEIGQALGASLTLMLLGERPGLSAADSLGAYLTWAPAPGRTDAQRNCISNIRTAGLAPTAAAARIAYYLHEARRLALTGTALKDPTPGSLIQGAAFGSIESTRNAFSQISISTALVEAVADAPADCGPPK